VRLDLLRALFHPTFQDTLFMGHALPSRAGAKTLFETLCQATPMRLGAASIDKLFDLMFMMVKYQILRCMHAPNILMVTLNHLETLHVRLDTPVWCIVCEITRDF
jgi:hypothetical protein